MQYWEITLNVSFFYQRHYLRLMKGFFSKHIVPFSVGTRALFLHSVIPSATQHKFNYLSSYPPGGSKMRDPGNEFDLLAEICRFNTQIIISKNLFSRARSIRL